MKEPGVWRVPVVLGVLTAVGLVAALFGDGLVDVGSCVLLAAPLAVAAWCILKLRLPSRSMGSALPRNDGVEADN